MPQLSKGGKFVFGICIVQDDLTVALPPQAVAEYSMACEGKVYLITGSKGSGGFVVTRKGLLSGSEIGSVLDAHPALSQYALPEGHFVKHKSRKYCWLELPEGGVLRLIPAVAEVFGVRAGSRLLTIKGSDIAFVMAAKGPLLEKARNYPGEIPTYR